MADVPRVSVGLAVYNGERFLAETLESHLTQTFPDFELIICDNASSDGTEAIARDFAARDRRVRYVRHPVNLGAAGNYRRAFALSRAPFFRWSAGDDLFLPESLARCVEVLERHPDVVLTYPKTRLIDERGAVIRDYEDGLHLQGSRASERFALLLARLGYCNALYGLMRADAMRRTRLVGDYIGSDEVFQAELALYGTFFEIPEFLFLRRMHEAASSSMTVLQKQAFYQPRGRPRAALTGWRHLGEHMRSVMNAPLSVGERLRLMRVLLRRAIGSREMLAGELVGAVRQLRPGPA